jgi:hypothetical protein
VGADPNIIANRNLSRLMPLLLKWDSIETVVGRPEDDIRANVNVGSESNTPTIGADPDSMVKSATRTDDDVTSPLLPRCSTYEKERCLLSGYLTTH